MIVTKEFADFVDRQCIPGYPVSGTVMVGSRARGYASSASDIDVMIFYATNGKLKGITSSNHEYHDHEVAIEHTDLDEFYRRALKHRYDASALRLLLKVRDGVMVRAEEPVVALIHLARSASLDMSVLLRCLSILVDRWPGIVGASPPARRQWLIEWTEVLATLDLLVRPGGPAYSKPKWLYRVLDTADLGIVVELLNILYQPTATRLGRMQIGLQTIARNHPTASLPPEAQSALRVLSKDAGAALRERPTEACPAIRAAAAAYYKWFYQSEYVDTLRPPDQACLPPEFEDIFESSLPAGYNEEAAERRFCAYAIDLADQVCTEVESECRVVLSNCILPYVFDSYGIVVNAPYAEELMPLRRQADSWISKVRSWCTVVKSRRSGY